jgi:hypothetical protein
MSNRLFAAMKKTLVVLSVIGTAGLLAAAQAAPTPPPAGYLDQLRAAATATPGFSGFSAERGRAFFTSPHGNDWSCSSCHGDRPSTTGKHARTGKEIAPLAPAANPERFADEARTEKWFRRNCNDVLGRACTPVEKGDVVTWLMSLKP